jgi:hypothetical protein
MVALGVAGVLVGVGLVSAFGGAWVRLTTVRGGAP